MTRAQVMRFLEGVSRGWSVTRACRQAGVQDLDAPNRLRKRDAAFSDAWRLAHEAGTDRFEDAATDRALNGTTKGIWHQGVLVGTEIRYDNRLLLGVLSARRPAKWRRYEMLGEDDDTRPPSIRGEDVLSILEQKLAGLEARASAFAIEDGTSEGPDA